MSNKKIQSHMPSYQEDQLVKKHLLEGGPDHYMGRVGPKDDEIAILLKGHLLIEYLMNKVIEKKCRSPKKILEGTRVYTFSVKLQIIYSMSLIPEYLYDNINRVNQLRNKYAHTLDFNLDKNSMRLRDPENEIISFSDLKNRPTQTYLWILCTITLAQLDYHMEKVLQIDPRHFGAARKQDA